MLHTVTTLDDDTKVVTVFANGQLHTATSVSHGNVDDIIRALEAKDENALDLFDLGTMIQKKFERYSDRVLISGDAVLFDGEEVNNALTNQILRFVNEGVDDFRPLVAFFEKLSDNPNDHSREQLYRWLDRHEFSITESGDFIAYKGVVKVNDGEYTSVSHGPAIVNGEFVKGAVPQPIDGIVEMARSEVRHDPRVGCDVGLHAGTWNYARDFARGAVLEVHINPRDVVSVPTDCGDQKIRTCRYKVVNVVDTAYAQAYVSHTVYADGDDYDDGYSLFECIECLNEVDDEGDLCDECAEELAAEEAADAAWDAAEEKAAAELAAQDVSRSTRWTF